MSYYDLTDAQKAKAGIDYDLGACLEYNTQPFDLEDIKKVLAVEEGERDSTDWFWVLKLNDGRFALLQGGCDYTGWDCQSSASTVFEKSAIKACKADTGRYQKNAAEVQARLLAQLKKQKTETWREKKDKELASKIAPIA